jgi:hypothetical protein
MANFLTSSSIAESLQGNNPLWKQAQIQSGNQQFLADQAMKLHTALFVHQMENYTYTE